MKLRHIHWPTSDVARAHFIVFFIIDSINWALFGFSLKGLWLPCERWLHSEWKGWRQSAAMVTVERLQCSINSLRKQNNRWVDSWPLKGVAKGSGVEPNDTLDNVQTVFMPDNVSQLIMPKTANSIKDQTITQTIQSFMLTAHNPFTIHEFNNPKRHHKPLSTRLYLKKKLSNARFLINLLKGNTEGLF